MIYVDDLVSELQIINNQTFPKEISEKLDPTIHTILAKLLRRFSTIQNDRFVVDGLKLYTYLNKNFKNPEMMNSLLENDLEFNISHVDKNNVSEFMIVRSGERYMIYANYDELELIKALITQNFPTYDYHYNGLVPAKRYAMHYFLIPIFSINRLEIRLEEEELIEVVQKCGSIDLDEEIVFTEVPIIPSKQNIRNYISGQIISELKKCNHEEHKIIAKYLDNSK